MVYSYRRGFARRGRRPSYYYHYHRRNRYNNYEYYGENLNANFHEEVHPTSQQSYGEKYFYGHHATMDRMVNEADITNEMNEANPSFYQQNSLNVDFATPELEPEAFQNDVIHENDTDLTARTHHLITLEHTFDLNFLQWEEKYLQWKRNHLDHPNRQLYRQYENEMERRRQSIMEMRQRIIEYRDQSMVGLRAPESDFDFLASLMYALRQAVERVDNCENSNEDFGADDPGLYPIKPNLSETLPLEPKTPPRSRASEDRSSKIHHRKRSNGPRRSHTR